jgi:hypothetical protein
MGLHKVAGPWRCGIIRVPIAPHLPVLSEKLESQRVDAALSTSAKQPAPAFERNEAPPISTAEAFEMDTTALTPASFCSVVFKSEEVAVGCGIV